jgi:formylmethanofuran dehydrogenase subunit E
MTISEKAAYLKGLMDGLNLDTEKAEGKMISAIVELLGDVTKRLTDVEETTIAISDELDEIEEDLDAIEDYILDEEDDEDDWYDEDEDDEELWDDDEEYEEGFEYGDEDSIIYEVECACGEVINFDEETLEKGSMLCPNCGETLEFSVEEDEDEPMPF